MGGDHDLEGAVVLDGVSIRAPAWGATVCQMGMSGENGVSIRAPAWGATGTASTRSRGMRSFNPRPRMGGDSVIVSNC